MQRASTEKNHNEAPVHNKLCEELTLHTIPCSVYERVRMAYTELRIE